MENIGSWTIKYFEQTSSTNDEAKKLVSQIKQKCIVIASKQNSGRGRRGRIWISQEGNLFVSFAFEAKLSEIGKLVILSAVTVFNVIKKFALSQNVKIKWPNDILVDGKKISGILFEKADGNFWIMGIGINVVSSPQNIDGKYETISLKGLGIDVNVQEVFENLVLAFDEQMVVYQQFGFDKIKQMWVDNAFNLGNSVTIRQEKEDKEGIFCGIGDNGELLLKINEETEKIIVGDLLLKEDL